MTLPKLTIPGTVDASNSGGNNFQALGSQRSITESPVHMTELDDGDEPKADEQENEEQGGPAEEDLEDDEEESEEDDEEPSLKYQRITGAIPDLLKKDSASALAISNRVMVHIPCVYMLLYFLIYHFLQAMGTHAGIIHILDLTGKRIKSYKPHMASIVDISLDATADFVATASIDGGLPVYDTENFALTRFVRTGRCAFPLVNRELFLRHETADADHCNGAEFCKERYKGIHLRRPLWCSGFAGEGMAWT